MWELYEVSSFQSLANFTVWWIDWYKLLATCICSYIVRSVACSSVNQSASLAGVLGPCATDNWWKWDYLPSLLSGPVEEVDSPTANEWVSVHQESMRTVVMLSLIWLKWHTSLIWWVWGTLCLLKADAGLSNLQVPHASVIIQQVNLLRLVEAGLVQTTYI